MHAAQQIVSLTLRLLDDGSAEFAMTVLLPPYQCKYGICERQPTLKPSYLKF